MVEPRVAVAGNCVSRREVLAIAVLLAIGWFVFQGNVGFRPQDEGYLWYNARQTVSGGVPVRDFRSYDPGRYYWLAGWFALLGDSYSAFRLSLLIVQSIGLWFGLMLIRKAGGRRWLLVAYGTALLLWMFPRYKCFEHALVLGILFFASGLMEKPDPPRHFAAGVAVGCAALFGKNLGVYFFLGLFSLILFLEWKTGKNAWPRKCTAFFSGVFAGYLPMIGMMLFVPGFFAAFVDSIVRIFGPFAPVKYVPVPWPWKVPLAALSFVDKMRGLIGGTSFVVLFIFIAIGIAYVFISRRSSTPARSLLTACIFIGAPLLHHVGGRANFLHLAQGIHPLLAGLVAGVIAARNRRRNFLAGLATLLFVAFAALPALLSIEVTTDLQKLKGTVTGTNRFVPYRIGRKMFWLPKFQSDSLAMTTRFLSQRMGPGENILIAPYEPGLYCLLGKKSPLWDAYPIHLAPCDEQMQGIRDMESKNVVWALVDLREMDGIKERSFPFTHEWLWGYILREFVAVDFPGSMSQVLFHRRAISP
jgi:hypothetical protein